MKHVISACPMCSQAIPWLKCDEECGFSNDSVCDDIGDAVADDS